jgi:signal transduction histidine kinase
MHGGLIWVESQGSTFAFTLIVERQVEAA